MAENYVLLETINLTQSAASVTFDNIPQTGYTDLKIVCSARSNRSSQGDYIVLAFNGNTTSYSAKIIEGYGTGVSNDTFARCAGIMNSDTSTANVFGNNEIYIPNYTSSNFKSYSAEGVTENNSAVAYQDLVAGLWSNTAAITSIVLSPNAGTSFFANSTFSLYGVAATGTTPVTAPKATGGNIVANDGTYWYHAFLTSGTFTPQTALTCDYLVVAGGGGGAGNRGGGGGAGGLLTSTYSATANTVFPVTIGARGNGNISDSSIPATKGSDSSVFGVTAYGGGAAVYGNQSFANGGSGAGGIEANTTGGTGTSGQGRNGGNGGGTGTGGSGCGGGGGGYTAAGSNASSSVNAGNGGAGWTITSTFSPSGAFGSMTVLSSGGGGGAPFGTAGTGGTGAGNGGSGTSSSSTGNGGNATSYGSGGGGGAYAGGYSGGLGGNGYQGVVVIRYAMV